MKGIKYKLAKRKFVRKRVHSYKVSDGCCYVKILRGKKTLKESYLARPLMEQIYETTDLNSFVSNFWHFYRLSKKHELDFDFTHKIV